MFDGDPRCDVLGGSPQQQTALGTAAKRAMRTLGFGGPVTATVGNPDHAPPGTEAGADRGGRIWVAKRIVREGEPRLGWIVSEEIGHVYLADRFGLPHGGTFIEVLIQELFGAWAQYREHVLTGRIPESALSTTPVMRIPPTPAADLPPQLGYQLGKHLAAAALGSRANDAHLRAWAADPSVADELKEVVKGLRRELPWTRSPQRLAEALQGFYVALGGSVEA
ncbi:hypothetical protein [Solirubrobacter pauli]|uniref:hypothetical protein n=1 Tax=Solirubrobacter pauli TaxID=166793 RepID=UPI0011C43E26|nr:hypothetical protein [Solirubrobacter pauli]